MSLTTGRADRAVVAVAVFVMSINWVSAQTSFDERRREMQRMLQEIESGETIYVPYGRDLVPMDREEFVQTLALAALAPLYVASRGLMDDTAPDRVARLTSGIPDLDAYRRRAREAWAATETLRRTLRAELARMSAGDRVFDATSVESLRGFLEGTWQLEVQMPSPPSGFREAVPKLADARVVIDHAACSAQPGQQGLVRQRQRCALTGSFILRAASIKTVEALRDASFSPGADGTASVRFAVAAPDVGGRLFFMGTVSADRGWMEEGRLVWSSAMSDEEVGTWTARRIR